MRVYLVTGAAGFIGSHICEELLKEPNNYVVGIDNFYSGKPENIELLKSLSKNFIFYEVDIRDQDEVSAIMEKHTVKYVFHEAAIASVQVSVENPLLTNDVNIKGSLSVLEAARRNNVSRFLFASSAAVFGDEPTLPKNEKSLTKPISPYGLEKLVVEQYLQLYSQQYGMECIALRYFNVYGPRQDPHSEYSGVISIFDNRVKQGLPITIYGDGEQYRDFIFVKDVAEINIGLMTSDSILLPYFQSFCVGTGKITTINHLVDILKKKYNRDFLTVNYAQSRVGDILESRCDNTSILKMFDSINFSMIENSI